MSENNGETLGGPSSQGGAAKDPDEWVSGDDPITESQKSYLDTLARQAGEELPADMTKAEASKHIERLRQATGTGDSGGTGQGGTGQGGTGQGDLGQGDLGQGGS